MSEHCESVDRLGLQLLHFLSCTPSIVCSILTVAVSRLLSLSNLSARAFSEIAIALACSTVAAIPAEQYSTTMPAPKRFSKGPFSQSELNCTTVKIFKILTVKIFSCVNLATNLVDDCGRNFGSTWLYLAPTLFYSTQPVCGSWSNPRKNVTLSK